MKNIFKEKALCLLTGLLCAFTIGFTQPIPLDTSVNTGRLPNGFTYFIRYNAEPKGRAILYLVNKIGALQEDNNQRGLAHFLEHMSFNGTRNYPKQQLIEYLQKAGVRFGADLNAYTSFGETVYQLPLPSDDTSVIRNGLQILRDWAGDVMLETEEINNERGVILEEKRLQNGAGLRLQDISFPLQVNNSRYATRIPIGNEEVLKTFTPDAIKRFYKDWYRPNQQAVIVVGDIDVKEIENQIKKLFGNLKNPINERPVIKYSIPLTGKNQFLAVTDPELTNTEINVMIKHRAVPLKTKADFRSHIVRSLFNQVLSNRLAELTTGGTEPPFIQSQAGLSGFLGGLDAFTVTLIPNPGKIKEGLMAVWTEIIRLQKKGITQSEFDRGKLAYLSSMENIYKEKNKIPSDAYVKDYLAWFLHGTAAPGIEKEYLIVDNIIGKITLEEVNALASRTIKPVDRFVSIFAAEKNKAELPTEQQVNAWLASVEHKNLSPWKDVVSDRKLMAALPASGKITSREWKDSIGVTIYTLNNDIKVWVKPTNFKNDEILFGAFSEGGTSVYPDSLFLQASSAASMIPANGLAEFGPIELNKLLTGKAVQVQVYVQDRYEGINGSSNVKDLETALQLTHLYFTKPRSDSSLFNNNINSNKALILDRGNNPNIVFNDTAVVVMNGHHYRRQPPSVARMDSLRLDKIFTIYKERFANAGDFTFVFTGSIDTTSFLPLIERYIGSLPATNIKEVAKDPGIYIPEGRISRTVYEGNDNKAVVRLYFSGDYLFNVANNTQLIALGAILQYHITQRIREVEGGAYTPRAGVSYVKLPRSRYLISIEFTCGPQNVERLIAAAKDETEKLKSGDIPQADIDKFKAEQLRQREIQLQTNEFWQSWLTSAIQNNESTTGLLKLKERLTVITSDSVRQAAKQFINDNNFIRLVLMPKP